MENKKKMIIPFSPKDTIKEYLPNILNGQNNEQIIGLMLFEEEKTQKDEIEVKLNQYRSLIEDFSNDSKVEICINNSNGVLELTYMEFAKKLLELFQLDENEKKSFMDSARIYAKKVIDEYWTRNQRKSNTEANEREL